MADIIEKRETPLNIYSVTRLNREVCAVLEGSFPMLWVQGEISNLAQPASGHIYFSLKDEYSQVRCVMFQNRNRLLKFPLENGNSVLLRASISLYEIRGEYQLIVDQMELAGEGILQRAFEELKQRLFKEGLFSGEHKHPVPQMAKRIGIITSPTGAAIKDILTVLRRRFPLAQLIIYPVAVQGEGAAEQIISMLQIAQRRNECEVLILARGGGSLEDLWEFNNEKLARAIFACSLPLVTGIGHEIDFTIADFVADKRAPTPSAAAEIVSADQYQIQQQLKSYREFFRRFLQQQIKYRRERIKYLNQRLPHPGKILQQIMQRFDDLIMRSQRAVKTTINMKHEYLVRNKLSLNSQNPGILIRLQMDKCRVLHSRINRLISIRLNFFTDRVNQFAHNMNSISPLATLGRGYAIIRQKNGTVVRQSGQLEINEQVIALLGKGMAELTVDKISKKHQI
jgi:exodeoxyribonuclease VII large subunit